MSTGMGSKALRQFAHRGTEGGTLWFWQGRPETCECPGQANSFAPYVFNIVQQFNVFPICSNDALAPPIGRHPGQLPGLLAPGLWNGKQHKCVDLMAICTLEMNIRV